MQVIIWLVTILLVILLLWILKRRIKRIIFILILLALAFFIYGLFSPSGAARLWYNVRTFPQRVTSRFSNQTFLDYDSYKLDVPSIGEKIGDKIGLSDGDNEDSSGDKIDTHSNETPEIDNNDNEKNDNSENEKNEDNKQEEQVIKSFPKSIDFIKLPSLNIKDTPKNGSQMSGYSKSDLIGVINKYLENNLDNETDVLVTVEYEDDFADPQKIILQTQSKSENVVPGSSDLSDTVYTHNGSTTKNGEVSENNGKTPKTSSNSNNSSSQLSVKDQRDAEEIFNILF